MPASDLPGSVIGYRKDGRPIRLIAGGDPSNDPAEPTEGDGNTVSMTKAELDKLLADARSRAYTKAEKASAQADALKAEVDRLAKIESDRAKAEENARKEAEAARKRAEEAELDAKALIERRSAELQEQYTKQADQWAAQVQGLQSQMAAQEALFAKEREFQELANYATDQVNANRDDIAPELIEHGFVTGNTREEIDASIERAKLVTQSILAGVQNAQITARSQMPGVSSGGFTPGGPIDAQGGQRVLTPEEIKAMPMDEFGANRAALGVTGGNVGGGRFPHLGQGLFG